MIIGVLALFGVSYSIAMPYIQNDTKKQNDSIDSKKTRLVSVDDDSVKTTRKALWRVQRTLPITWHDLDSSSLDLKTPFNPASPRRSGSTSF